MSIEDPKQRDFSFRYSKKNQRNKNKSTSLTSSSDEESNEEMEKFDYKLKRGIGKYRGKIPLKWFKYGNICHFASKCPLNINSEYNSNQVNRYSKKKSFFTKI